MTKVWFITGSSKGFGRDLGGGGARPRRQGGGDRPRSGHAHAARRELRRRASRQWRSTSPTRPAVEAAVRRRTAVRPARRGHQQCRLRPVRRRRGGDRGGGAGPDRDQRVRRAVGDAGGTADHAGAGLRPHHPDLLDRRRQRLSQSRPLSRLEMGAGRLQPGAQPRSRRASAST